MLAYKVKIPVFEGPLALLMHLIEKNEVDIYDIPIAVITEQYLEYLDMAGEIDLELTSEFLVMACTLLTIKAKMLLPKPKIANEEVEEVDPRQELIDKLLEYKEYKEKASSLKDLEEGQGKVYWRQIDEVQLLKEFPPPNPIGNVTLEDLLEAFQNVLTRLEVENETVSITREEVSLQDRISYIQTRLREKPRGLAFSDLFEKKISREKVVVTFLAVLELTRRGVIMVRQHCLFADIIIFSRDPEGELTDAHPIS